MLKAGLTCQFGSSPFDTRDSLKITEQYDAASERGFAQGVFIKVSYIPLSSTPGMNGLSNIGPFFYEINM
eukprot:snap_masked-scaffold_18-processed-gene-3.39-mRNA-1 protein AED:1.00 eAED:1.00 QI:0/0/0/0/1/1/2/0/69